MRFQDIPQPPHTVYEVDISWTFLDRHLDQQLNEEHLVLNPEFQRGHVWKRQQRIDYVEYCLQGGSAGRQVFLNHPHWSSLREPGGYDDYVLVDGLQRVTTAQMFMSGKLRAFGHYIHEFEDKLSFSQAPRFRWCIVSLRTYAAVLKFYLSMNTGGTVHSRREITRVRGLLEQETAKVGT